MRGTRTGPRAPHEMHASISTRDHVGWPAKTKSYLLWASVGLGPYLVSAPVWGPIAEMSRAALYYDKLRSGVKLRTRTDEWDQEMDYQRELKQIRAARMTSVMEVTNSDDLERIGFEKQADVDLSSEERLRARFDLRNDPRVKEVLDAFWVSMKKTPDATIMLDGGDAESTADDDIAISWTGYYALFIRAYKLLLEEFDEEQAYEDILEDWDDDAAGEGGTGLRYRAWCECLFELADMCTPEPHTVHRSQCIQCIVQH